MSQVKLGQIERLDDHHKAILDYIRKNPKRTENQVVKAMDEQKVCSKMTTLRKLDELVKMQELKDLLEEGEKGFHKFVISDKNAYNWIRKELSEIEDIISNIGEPVNRIWNAILYEIRGSPTGFEDGINEYVNKNSDIFEFLDDCEYSIQDMLHLLLILTERHIKSEKDCQLLYTRIIDLIIKLKAARYNRNAELTLHYNFEIYRDNLYPIPKKVHPFVNKNKLNLDFTKKLAEKIDEFQREMIKW